ncbi:MAG: cyanophycin synthetase [Pirellulales bacterium]|nr:cyanophycin synthetase [Pirellulales bacterium]
MEIRKVLTLAGPNVWANFPVLEAWVDLQELKDSPSDELPGFNERLMSWLPTMIEHRCSIGERGGFFERLRRGTWQGHILEHVTLELQTLAGCPVGFGRARETAEEGVYRVVIEYEEEALARAALETAFRLCQAAVHDRPFDVAAEVARLREIAADVRLGPSTRAIVDAAVARGIPFRRMNANSLVQLGYGTRQRRIVASETDATSAIAESIAQDKELTRNLLASAGVPVPCGWPVDNAEEAWEAAQSIGLPVVVKPQFGNHGRGVATNLKTREEVLSAYAAARQEEETVMVESFAPGCDHRLLVVGGRLVAAARREPAHVIGDGEHTIDQLIDAANRDPRRGDGHANTLSKIRIDDVARDVLAAQGFTGTSVPAVGQRILIRRNGNLSTGGTATDVTDEVDPEVAARAIEAARVVGLDVAGIDVVALDIRCPLEAQGGVIVEVNACPGLRMHVQPSEGTSRPVGEAIVELLFPNNDNGRIPLVAVTGTNGKTTTTRLVTHILKTAGKLVGMTCTDGLFLDGRRIDQGDCSGPQSARSVLMNPHVEAAVLETARGGILRAGLGFDRCDVAIVTNLGQGDHLGLGGVETLEQLAKVKRTIVDVVAPTGAAVLNAADPMVADMASYCPGSVIFFALEETQPRLAEHRQTGGAAVFVRDGSIILTRGEEEIVLTPLASVPLARDGRVRFMVENVLAAAAAAWSLGLPLATIRAGLGSFAGDADSVPGRFNILKVGGATVIVDYGHNLSALAALIEAIRVFPHERRVAVYSAAGDRRDEDMVVQGELLGREFDRVLLYEDHYTRGRADGEIIKLLRQGMQAGGRVTEVFEIRGSLMAVEGALEMTRAGDLLLIQADVIDETVDFVRNYLELHRLWLDTPAPAECPERLGQIYGQQAIPAPANMPSIFPLST